MVVEVLAGTPIETVEGTLCCNQVRFAGTLGGTRAGTIVEALAGAPAETLGGKICWHQVRLAGTLAGTLCWRTDWITCDCSQE